MVSVPTPVSDQSACNGPTPVSDQSACNGATPVSDQPGNSSGSGRGPSRASSQDIAATASTSGRGTASLQHDLSKQRAAELEAKLARTQAPVTPPSCPHDVTVTVDPKEVVIDLKAIPIVRMTATQRENVKKKAADILLRVESGNAAVPEGSHRQGLVAPEQFTHPTKTLAESQARNPYIFLPAADGQAQGVAKVMSGVGNIFKAEAEAEPVEDCDYTREEAEKSPATTPATPESPTCSPAEESHPPAHPMPEPPAPKSEDAVLRPDWAT